MAVHYIPEGYGPITPYLKLQNAAKAIDWYKQTFGAKEVSRMPMPDGRIMHAELQIDGSHIMLGDEFPEMGGKAPQTLGGTPVGICLYVPDVDAVFNRAVQAGATAQMKPEDMFWGDRYSKLLDPFGHEWSIATHIEDVSPDEMQKRAAEAAKQMSGQ
jgi:PhnB protein